MKKISDFTIIYTNFFSSLTISCLENYDGKECDNVMMIKLGKS